MDRKVKRGLKSRSERDRVRRRDGIVKTTRCQSSGSDIDQSPPRVHGPLRNLGKCTNLYPSRRPPRLPRRKRRGSARQEEDIVDGFAITSFLNLDYLELAPRQKTQSLRLYPDRMERWERQLTKRRRMDRRRTDKQTGNSLMSFRGFADQGDVIEADVEGETERREITSNKQQVTDQRTELTRLLRTNSTGCQSEAESSFSGRGYSCDSESDIDERMTVTKFDELLTFKASTGMDVKDEATVCRSDRVSGLQRSQEESSDMPFTVPASSPAPASSPTPLLQPETSLASTQTMAPPPVCVKEERASPHTPPSPGLSAPQDRSSLLQACSLRTGPWDSRVQEPNKPTPPEPSGLEHRSSPLPALPPSKVPVPSCFQPGRGPHHPALFHSPLPLPPSAIAATGHPVGSGYSEHDLLRLELNNRFLSQNASSTPPLLRAEFHQHQYQHQQVQHHNFTPYPTSGPRPPSGLLSAASMPTIGRSTAPNTADPYKAAVKQVGKWCAMHAQIAWQIHHHQHRLKQLCGDSLKLNMKGRLDLFSRPAGLSLPPGLPYLQDLTPPLLPSGHLCMSPFSSPYHYPVYLPNNHVTDRFNQTSSHGSLRNMPSNAFLGLGPLSGAPGSPFNPRPDNRLINLRSAYHNPWNRVHPTLPSFSAPEPPPKVAAVEYKPTIQDTDREKDVDKGNDTTVMEHSRTDRRQTFSSSFQISNLIGCHSPERKRSSPAQGGQSEMDEVPLRKVQIKQRSSPSAETLDKGTSEHLTTQEQVSSETNSSLKSHLSIKQEQREEPEVEAGPPGPSYPPSSGYSTIPHAGGFQSTHLPHSLPLPMIPRQPVSSLSALEQARVQPFTGISPQSASPLPGPWEPLRHRDPDRGLYVQNQQLTYDLERDQRQRVAPSQQREQRAKLHQLQGSPMEGHLAHTAPSRHPRLSPSAPHNRHLNRTPPSSTESAPPPLVSIVTDTITRTDCMPGTGNGRPASPSGATPSDHAPTSGDLPFSKSKVK